MIRSKAKAKITSKDKAKIRSKAAAMPQSISIGEEANDSRLQKLEGVAEERASFCPLEHFFVFVFSTKTRYRYNTYLFLI